MENENVNVTPKKKKGNVATIIVVVLLLVIIGSCGYIGYKKLNDKDTDKSKDTKEVKNTKKDFDLSKFDGTKCLNTKEKYALIDLNTYNYDTGISTFVSEDGKGANITVSLAKYVNKETPDYGYVNNRAIINEGSVSLKIAAFNKKISKIVVGHSDQAAGYENIFYILEDGTLYYSNVVSKLNSMKSKDDNLLTVNPIKDMTDINTIVPADYPEHEVGGGTFIAVRYDGSFYDLFEIINKVEPLSTQVNYNDNNNNSNTNSSTAFDGTKSLNTNLKYELAKESTNSNFIQTEIVNNTSVKLTINLAKYKEINIITNTNVKNESSITLNATFNKKVTGVYIGESEQSFGYETLFVVLEDGSLYYGYIVNKINAMTSTSDTTLSVAAAANIKGINKIVPACVKGSELVTCTYLAVKPDGSFYDLNQIVTKAWSN